MGLFDMVYEANTFVPAGDYQSNTVGVNAVRDAMGTAAAVAMSGGGLGLARAGCSSSLHTGRPWRSGIASSASWPGAKGNWYVAAAKPERHGADLCKLNHQRHSAVDQCSEPCWTACDRQANLAIRRRLAG
jgi:hypothetical protein